jgi:hypothetical protein
MPQPHRHTGTNPGFFAVVLLSALSLLAADASAESGLQIAPDHKGTVISKDVGDQRWSIVYNEDDGTVIGNVYQASGGEPSFVWCRTAATTHDSITLECSGAGRCPAFPCSDDEWTPLPPVTLPSAFFQPAGKPDDVWVTSVPQILQAIQNAPAGTAIRILAGAYRLTEPIVIARDDITLMGSGNQTSFTLESNAGAPLFVIGRAGTSGPATHGITLQRMRLDGNRAHQPTSGDAGSDCIFSSGADGVLLEDLQIEGCSRAGVHVDTGSDVVLRRVEAFDNAGDGVVFGNGANASRIDTGTLRDNIGSGISLLPGSDANELLFCLVRNNQQAGLRLLGSSDNLVRNSILQANGSDGIVLADGAPSSGAANNVMRSNQYLENAGHGVYQTSTLGSGNQVAGGGFRCNAIAPISQAPGATPVSTTDDPQFDSCVP